MKKAGTIFLLCILYLGTAFVFFLLCAAGNRVVTVVSDQIEDSRRICIILDAGHGGEDGGAISCTGKPESSYNLQIALRLECVLNLMGLKTEMIRRTDTSVYTEGATIASKKVSDLKARVKTVNQTPDGLLVSIHQNTFPDRRCSGAQVFYASDEGSKALAKDLQDAICRILNPDSHRKAKQSSGVYLMDRITCPGILVECGFLSNPEEEALLASPAYQKKISGVIAAAVSTYCAKKD